jgi:hypothetical protein
MRIGDLANVLIGGNPTTVLGFDRIVTTTFTKPIAERIVRFVVMGIPTDEWEKELQNELGDGLVFASGVEKSGDETAPAPGSSGSGSAFADRGRRLRGRDIVELLDPMSGLELEDGASIRIIGQPDDGSADRIRFTGQVIGTAEDEDPGAFDVKVEVKAQGGSAQTLPYESPVDERVHRYAGEVPLGFDVTDGQIVDIEISTEIPSGGTTSWLYEDIELLGAPCEFHVSLTGGGGGVMVPELGDDLQTFTLGPTQMIGIEQENEGNMVMFSLQTGSPGVTGTFEAAVTGAFQGRNGSINYTGQVDVTLVANGDDLVEGTATGSVTVMAPPYDSYQDGNLSARFAIGHNPESTEVADPAASMTGGMVGPIRACGVSKVR